MLFLGVVFSCSHSPLSLKPEPEGSHSSMETLRKELISDRHFSRESPFVARAFNPYANGKWIGNAVSYGCYRKGQAPGYKGPSEAEIVEDLTIISNYWHLIRVYGADGDSERILQVIEKYDLPVNVMLGVWLENESGNPQ